MDYKEKLKLAKKAYSKCVTNAEKRRWESVFPELKESEDEIIRKALIEYFSFNKEGSPHALDNITPKQVVAWLKNQEEKKFININDIKEKAHKIAWETSKHYDPNVCKQQWCEMAALDMALWLEKGIITR